MIVSTYQQQQNETSYQTTNNGPTPSSSSSKSKITVCVRLRPTIPEDLKSANAIRNAPEICVHLKSDGQSVKLIQDRFHSRVFKVDHTFGVTTSQTEVYNIGMKPIVSDVLRGYNGTAIVYGQTASGKTYTMFGNENKLGIAHFAISDIFDRVQEYEENNLVAKVFMSFYQIYVEQIFDLLADSSSPPQASQRSYSGTSQPNPSKQAITPLNIREDNVRGVHVEGLTTYNIKDKATAQALIAEGILKRKVHSTTQNIRSSRSHAILQIFIDFEETNLFPSNQGVTRTQSAETQSTNTTPLSPDEQKFIVRRRKLMLVDLAGSERVSSHRATSKQQLKEASIINKSIAALGNCISALSNSTNAADLGHVPYRDTKLTRLLAESLGGNSKTCIITNISPCSYSYEETYSTLKFAMRAKMVTRIVKNANDELPLDTQLLTYVQKSKLPNHRLTSTDNANNNENTNNDVSNALPGISPEKFLEDQDFAEDGSLNGIPVRGPQHFPPHPQGHYPSGYFSAREGRGGGNDSGVEDIDDLQSAESVGNVSNRGGRMEGGYYLNMNEYYNSAKPPLQFKRLLHGENGVNASQFSLKDFLKSCTANNPLNNNGSGTGSRATGKTTNYDGSSNTSDIDDSTIQDDYYESEFIHHVNPHLQELHPLIKRSQSLSRDSYMSGLSRSQSIAVGSSSSALHQNGFQAHLLAEQRQLQTQNGIDINDLNISLASIAAGSLDPPNLNNMSHSVGIGGDDDLSNYTGSPKSQRQINPFYNHSSSRQNLLTPATVEAFIQTTSKPMFADSSAPDSEEKTNPNQMSRSTSPVARISRQNSFAAGDRSVVTMTTYQNPLTKKIMVDKAIQSNKLIHAQQRKRYDGSLTDFTSDLNETTEDKSTEMDFDLLVRLNNHELKNINLDFFSQEDLDLMKQSIQNPLLLFQQVMELKKQLLEKDEEIESLKKFILESV